MKQTKVLRALYPATNWMMFGASLKSSTFDEVHAPIFKLLKRWHEKYHTDATPASLEAICPGEHQATLDRVNKAKLPESNDIVTEMIQQWARRKALLDVIAEASVNIDKAAAGEFTGNPLELVMEKLGEVEQKFSTVNHGVDITHVDASTLFNVQDDRRKTCPTPVADLTNALDGGPSSGELLIYLARTNRGKSTMLINTARHASEVGLRVLYYTLEDPIWRVTRRYYTAALQCTEEYLKDHPEAVRNYQQWLHDGTGFVRIIDAVEKEPSVGTLRFELERYLREAGDHNAVDALLIDYIDLVRSSKGYSSARDEQREVVFELKRLAMQFGIPIITAAQLNREGAKSDAPDERHVGDSYMKSTRSDFLVLVSRTDEQEIQGKASLRVLKAKRRTSTNEEIPCILDGTGRVE